MDSYRYQLNINSLLARTVYRKPRTEIVYGDKRYSWLQFYERVRKLASSLESLGVKKGTRVGVLDFDTHRYLELYYAVPMMGAVLHTVNIRLAPEHIAYTINEAEDEVLMVRDDFLPLVSKLASSLKRVRTLVTMSDTGVAPSFTGSNAKFYDDLLESGDAGYTFREPDENDIATIFYTSGTTGMPKGVWFTHRQIVLHSLGSLVGFSMGPKQYSLEAGDVMMPVVPFFHVHCWGMPYNAGLLGSKFVLVGKYEPLKILELVRREGVTFSAMVPSILNMVLNHPSVAEYKEALSRWKVVIGGAALPRGLAVKAKMLGIRVMSGYGLSETAPVLTLATPSEQHQNMSEDELLDRVLLKTGLPIPLVQLRVVDEAMNDVPRDSKTPGEIVVRTPWLTPGYYKDEKKSEELWRGGWLHTGDMAVVDEDGYITIVDRLRDAIRSGSEWISSVLLEDYISRHPAVVESAVIGVKDEKWGERPLAVIYAKERVTEQQLAEHLAKFVEEGKLAKFWIPDKFVVINEPLPKTSTGKIDKKPLREKFKSLDTITSESMA
ncbi:MAG: long-chain fatty acid--CoA ligase [Conexivisphaerales archaeon]